MWLDQVFFLSSSKKFFRSSNYKSLMVSPQTHHRYPDSVADVGSL